VTSLVRSCATSPTSSPTLRWLTSGPASLCSRELLASGPVTAFPDRVRSWCPASRGRCPRPACRTAGRGTTRWCTRCRTRRRCPTRTAREESSSSSRASPEDRADAVVVEHVAVAGHRDRRGGRVGPDLRLRAVLPCRRRVAVGVDRAADQTPGGDTGSERAEQERARLAGGEAAHLAQHALRSQFGDLVGPALAVLASCVARPATLPLLSDLPSLRSRISVANDRIRSPSLSAAVDS
jgi:hypothetical protein